jgi:hypothetical protein
MQEVIILKNEYSREISNKLTEYLYYLILRPEHKFMVMNLEQLYMNIPVIEPKFHRNQYNL